jgi:Methyltransferase domain
MTEPAYLRIVRHYESCLRRFGAGPNAVDWKSGEDAAVRYSVMLDVIRDRSATATLLDFGCGLAGLKDHMDARGLSRIAYSGLDLSPEFVACARERHPGVTFYCGDVLTELLDLPSFDYIVMNGIFTRRHDLGLDEMRSYLECLLLYSFALTRIGLAFNVMSKCVDWESEALFHACPGELAEFICRKATPHFVLRNDYGLYETTCYLYREPRYRRDRSGASQ